MALKAILVAEVVIGGGPSEHHLDSELERRRRTDLDGPHKRQRAPLRGKHGAERRRALDM